MSEAFDRQKLIREKIGRAEVEAEKSLALIRRAVRDFLVNEKGYSEEDIEVDMEFDMVLDAIKTTTSVDFILKLNGKRFMVIKCSPGALESRERHLISFARVVDSYQIPFAVVTDGSVARVLDVVSGKLFSEGLGSLPERSQAAKMLDATVLIPYPSERMEREKRILLAFDSIKCTEESGG